MGVNKQEAIGLSVSGYSAKSDQVLAELAKS